MKANTAVTMRLDDLRSMASALLSASGMRPDVAATLAGHLLWFDAAGLLDHGIATLPDLLDRIHRGEVDPKTEGKVGPERAALAVLDGQKGAPSRILGRAAQLAAEKAREYGSGIVRVKGIGAFGSAIALVSEIAIGPAIGFAFGPGGAWSAALPSAEGLPVIADAVLGSDPAALAAFAPWSPLIGEEGWIIQAVSVPAMEPLASFHERVAHFAKKANGNILPPDRLESLRREARENGVKVSKATQSALTAWAEKLGIVIA
jgi:LDH2 family malate/lactate/ureidoglycolate dehydrogenase